MPDAVPQKIGKYEIQAELGRGGFGRVYRGFDPKVGRLVAIKILNADGGHDLMTRFKNEAAAAGKLQHRNIVTVYEFGEDKGLPFIAMEHLEGEDLQQVLSSGKPLTLLDKIEIMSQVAEGLDCAHRNGIVHRDVKPANIRLLPDGTVKIMDFGIARLLHDSMGTRLTRQGHVIGTLLYMSPEQVLGSDTDSLCDIFSFGVTYYELLTGVNPFSAADPRAVFYKITSEDPAPVRSYAPDCPEALDQALRKALHKERDLRYQSLRDLLFDTEPVQIELRQEKAARLLVEAITMVDAGDLEGAQKRLTQAVDLDPSNRGARQLRENVQTSLRRRALKPRIDALLAKAEAADAAGKHTEAVDSLEMARQLDPADDAIQTRLQETRARVERARRAVQLVTEARGEAARQNLAAALQKVSDALEADPANADAAVLVSKLRKEIEDREQRRRLDEKLREARELLLAGAFDEAASVLDALEPAQRRSDEVKDLQARIKAHKVNAERQEQLRSELAAARDMVDRLQFAEAVDVLRRLKAEFPGEERVSGLLTYAQQELLALERSRAIERLRAEILAHAQAHEFEPALAILERGLSEFKDEPSLLRLRHTVVSARARWARQQAIESAVSKAEELAARHGFADALQLLDSSVAEYPDASELIALRERIATDWDSHKRSEIAREALERARSLMSQGDPAGAVRVLESALASSDPRLEAPLAEAREAIEAKVRHEAVEKAVREARAAAQAWQFPRALQIVDRALRAWPGEAQLEDVKSDTLAAQARWEREEIVVAALRNAGALRAQMRFGDALAQLESCRDRFPDEQRIAELYARIQSDWDRHVRAEAVARAETETQTLLDNGRPEEAAGVIRRALEQYPGEKSLVASLARAEAMVREQRRAEAIRHAESQVRAAIEAKEFQQALDGIEACRREWPDEAALGTLYDHASAAKMAYEKQVAVESALTRATEHADRGGFTEALRLIDSALRKHPSERRLEEARHEIEAAWERRRRADAIRRAITEASERRASGDCRAALDILKRAAARYGTDPDLQSALESAEPEIAAQERADAIAAALTEACALTLRDQFDRALAVLSAALRSYPDDEQILEAHRHTASAKTAWEREREIEAALSAAGAHAANARFDEARAALAPTLAKYADDNRLANAARQIEDDSEAAARRKAIEDAVAFSTRLVRGGDPAKAVQALEAALGKWAGEPSIENALRDARDADKAQRRERAIQSAVSQANAAIQSGNAAGAVEILERAANEFPAAAGIQDALERAHKAQRAEERERALRTLLDRADEAVRSGDPARAVAILQAAPEDMRTAPAREAALRTAQHAADRLERQRAVQSAAVSVRRHLEAARFDEALSEVNAALGSYPSESELADLRREALAAQAEAERCEREHTIQAAIESARGRVQAGDFDAALQELDGALRRYPDANALKVIRERTLSAKTNHQREQAIACEVRRCEELIGSGQLGQAAKELQAAISVFPGEQAFVTLQGRLQQHWERQRRADSIRRAVASADQLLSQSQPDRAVSLLQAAAAQYPGEPELADALARASSAVREQHRADAIESTCRQTRIFLDRQEYERALETIEQGVERSGAAEQLTRLQQTVLQARTEWERTRPAQRQAPKALRKQAGAGHTTDSAVTDEIKVPPLGETILMPAPASGAIIQPSPKREPPKPPAQDRFESRETPPQPPPSPPNRHRATYVIALIGAIAAIALGWFGWRMHESRGPSRVVSDSGTVQVTSEPSGATVKVGGKACTTPDCAVEARPGSIRVQASLPGYATAVRDVNVERGEAAPIHFSLQPLAARLHISSNFPSGDLAINGQSAGSLQDGQISRELPSGRVEVRIKGAGSAAGFIIRNAPGKMPSVELGSGSGDLDLVAVTALGGNAEVSCSACSGSAILDGHTNVPISGGRIPLSNLSKGPHELRAGDRTVGFQVSDSPSVTVQLTSAASNAGTLVIGSNEDGATALIDRKRYSISGRELRVALEPREYTVSVQKDGFRAAPSAVKVRVGRGDQARASFRLEPETVELAFVNFPAATQVTVDGRFAGSVQTDGRLTAQVKPGPHTIAFKAEGYQSLSVERSVTPLQRTIDGASMLTPARREPEPPPKPDPVQQERQAWATVQATRDPDQLENFLRSYPAGQHAVDARARLEQLLWDRVDKNDRRALEGYRARFPDSQAAKNELARLDRLAAEAQQQREAESRAVEAGRKLAGDRQAIKDLLRAYADAYEQKDTTALVALRPGLAGSVQEIKRSLERYRSVKAGFALQGEPEMHGDTAVVRAVFQVETVDVQQRRQQPIAYTITCARRGNGWVIESMK